jgi:hypothetical protein
MRATPVCGMMLGVLAALCGCGHEDQPRAEYPPLPAPPPQQQQANVIGNEPRATAGPPGKQAVRIDAEADQLLRRMSDYLGNLHAFTFVAEHSTEVVLDSGQKLAFTATSDVSVRRPNKLRSNRRGQLADVSFFYDGKTLTIYGKKADAYAQAEAPPTLDEAIDFARDRLDLEAPGADLLYSNPYQALTEDGVSGTRVGTGVIEGTACDHLAFRGGQTDWQLWIEQGDRPLPRRYVITTRDVASFPEFSVEMHDWNTSAELSDAYFDFVPPANSRRIEFLAMAKENPERSKQRP